MTRIHYFSYLPGIGVLILGAILARALAPLFPGVNDLFVAVIAGVLLTNVVGLPEWITRGVRTHKIWLGGGIVLMGSSLKIAAVLESGVVVLLTVISITGFALFYVELLSRKVFGITDQLPSLLAAGTSICGISAIAAVAGSIDAQEEEIAYAAATVLLFDAVTLVVYPFVSQLLGLSAKVFGIWAGVSMFSTGPVVAVGFTHSDVAGQWATITKLTRNVFIGLVAVGYAIYYARKRVEKAGENTNGSSVGWQALWDRFPKFILGFLLLVAIASLGLISSQDQQSIENAYGWMFLIAFVGLGTDIEAQKIRCAGIQPILAVLIAFTTISLVSLGALAALFG